MSSALQLIGAVAILVPFAGSQFGELRTDSRAYLLPNLAGSALLAALALHGSNWGFLLLEGCWALVAAYGLLRRA